MLNVCGVCKACGVMMDVCALLGRSGNGGDSLPACQSLLKSTCPHCDSDKCS